MATEFQKVYNKFLFQIKDNDLLKLMDEDLEMVLFNYLENATTLEFKQCKKNLSDIDTTLKQFNEDLTNEEVFIIALGMVLHWLQPKINKENLLRQSIGDRDYKVGSTWETLGKLMQLESNTQKKLNKYIKNYQYLAENSLENL